jgi:hypothetical protein
MSDNIGNEKIKKNRKLQGLYIRKDLQEKNRPSYC